MRNRCFHERDRGISRKADGPRLPGYWSLTYLTTTSVGTVFYDAPRKTGSRQPAEWAYPFPVGRIHRCFSQCVARDSNDSDPYWMGSRAKKQHLLCLPAARDENAIDRFFGPIVAFCCCGDRQRRAWRFDFLFTPVA